MSSAAYHRARLAAMYAKGLCINCGEPHTDISRKTQRPAWRCKHCRDVAADQKKQREAEHRAEVTCACGRLIRAEGQNWCFLCRVKHKSMDAQRVKRLVPVNLPNAIYTQHDPIAARYRWGMAVGVR